MSQTQVKVMGNAIRDIKSAVARYSIAYHEHFGSKVGDDAIMGDEGIAPILEALLTLLNGPSGDIKCGEMANDIREMARGIGVEVKS